MDQKQNKKTEFKDIKEGLTQALNEKIDLGSFQGEDKGFTLIDGIFMQPIQSSVSGDIIIGGPTVPTIGIVSNKSGRIYYFALKTLMPDLGI